MQILGLNQAADVYTPDEATGDFTTLATAGLRVRLAHRPTSASEADERAELAHKRILMWSPGYEMPPSAQVQVEGRRWNVRPGTATALRGLDETIIYWRAEVVEAD